MLIFMYILLSFLLGVITFCCCLYLFIYKKKYTRERFAFSLLLHYSSILALFLQYVLAPDYLASVINYVLKEILHLQEIKFDQPGIVIIVAASIIIFAYFNVTYKLHKNWNGGKSVEEIENRFGNQQVFFFQESLQFIKNPDSRILGHEEPIELGTTLSYEQMEVEDLVWRIQAAELLKLKDAQYKIDIKNHWYSKGNCYITKYGGNEQIVAILCCSSLVSDAKISAFVKFVNDQVKGEDNIRYILAIQENVEISNKQIDDCKIEIVTEKELYNTLVDFGDYKRYVMRNFAEKEIYEGNGLTINDIYVEPQCCVYDVGLKRKESIESIERYIADWLNNNSQHKQLALLGEYGQGKSVLSQRIAYLILSGQLNSERIPIIIELRGRYVKQYSDTKEILYSWANRFNIAPKALLKLHYAGRLLLIFEGFDELDLIGGEEIRKEHFRKLWEYSIPKSKIIITGRPNYFMDDREMSTLLRLSQQRADSSKYCEIIHLEPFQRDQIIAAMRSVKPNVQDEIISVYDHEADNSSFKDLVSRPSLLFLTGLIWEKEQLASKLSNINSAEVIRTFLTYSYKRQDEKRNGAIMNSDERAYFMQGIAVAIVNRHGYTNQIGRQELETIVGRLFHSFPNEITQQSGNANKKLLKNRLDENHLLQAINTDIRSCGILIKDFSTEDAFCFAHKSFLEVLIAEFVAESYMMKKSTSNRDLCYKKIATLSNTLKINFSDNIFTCDENLFKFVAELLTTKVVLKGKWNSKEKVYGIYNQLHFYPCSLRFLGYLIAIFGTSFISKPFRAYFTSTICLFPIYLFLISGLSIQALIVALMTSFSILTFLVIGNWFVFRNRNKGKQSIIRPNHKNKNFKWVETLFFHFTYLIARYSNPFSSMGDPKIVTYYMVCRSLKCEEALKGIWPTYVFNIVKHMAESINSKTSSSKQKS